VIRIAAGSVNAGMMVHASTAPLPNLSLSWPRFAGRGVRHLALSKVRLMDSRADEKTELNDMLVAVGCRRDRAAFKALFEHFAPRVKGYLLRLGTTGGAAEDLAQEAMLMIWRKAAMFDPGKASASTWIFTIARNLRIDAIRRERRPTFDPNDPAFVPDAEPQADAQMVRAEQEDKLIAAVRTLPPDQAKVIEMSFFADTPHTAIAQALGLPLGTVKSRLRLAMARIRASLGSEEE
jgi:RNA polymerase sigma-70 factor (ECF subfamily)